MTAMSRATRRIVVAHLAQCGMNPAEIASELGISRDTVRRDIAEAPDSEPEPAAPVAAPPAPGLLLPETTQTTRDLNLLAAAYKAQPEDVTRFAIHHLAQAVRRRWAAAGAAQEAREKQQA